MQKRNLTIGIIAVSVVLALIGAGIVYTISGDEPELQERSVEMGPLTQRLTSVTSLHVAGSEMTDIDDIETSLSEQLPGWIDGASILVPGYDVSLRTKDITVSESEMFADIPSPALNIIKGGNSGPNSIMFGETGALPLVPSVVSHVKLELILTPQDHGKEEIVSLSYTSETVDTERALHRLLDHLESDMNGWTSGMARDVEYMLNSLVRLRANNGVGTKFTDNYLHLLNEGDVELAVNFALALRYTAWTGSLPEVILDRIDAYYSEISYSTIMDPSGDRSWGESEKDNFKGYVTRSKGEYPRRSAADLLTLVSDLSQADPADLFLRYLYMDRTEGVIGSMEPIDLKSPLEENQLINPRQPTDRTDPYSLEHHITYPDSNGIQVFSTEDLGAADDEARSFKPSFDSSYLVSGLDLEVKGTHELSAWYTNADPSLTDKDLTNWGNQTQFEPTTRCGAVPPPPEPAVHDFRVQWDLDISGTIDVTGKNTGWSGNTYTNREVSRDIDLSFPVRVFAGTGDLVIEGFPTIYNLNSGLMFYTAVSTGWIITPEANATEYFENDVWPTIRNAFSHITGMARSAGRIETGESGQEIRRSLHYLSTGGLSSMSDWSDSYSTRAQKELSKFYTIYIKEKGLDISALDPIRVEGNDIEFSYSPGRDRLDIISNLPEGQVTLRVWPVSGGSVKTSAIISMRSGSRIELDIQENSFSIHGRFGGVDIFEGSSNPKAPKDQVWSLLGTGTGLISQTVTIPIDIQNSGYLYDTSSYVQEPEISAGVVLRSSDILSVGTSELPEITNNDILELFRKTVPLAQDLGLSIGLQVSYKGNMDSTRSVVFASLTEEDLERLEINKGLENIFDQLVLSSTLDIEPVIGEEVLLTETFQDVDGKYFTSAAHFSPLGTVTFSYFGDTFEYRTYGSWTNIEGGSVSPLW